jgi:hypothetical protein
MSEGLTFFVPYHTGYAHAELIHSFSSYTDVHLFIYKWNPARERIKEHFATDRQIHIDEFSVENILTQLQLNKHRKVVVLLTASTNYLFGQLQLHLFRVLQQYAPSLIDVYPVGHCMYGCQSCAYAYTHRIPITFTNYIRRRNDDSSLERHFEILICPSYSFKGAPFSFLSNPEIMDYIGALKCSHAIKLHPLAYESDEHEHHPFLSLTELEREHVQKLLAQSKSVLSGKDTNTLKLIEQARVIICDSNSSIPFETLYFQDNKFIFVYETDNDYDEQDDRQDYFHKFQNLEQLKVLMNDYLQQQLECKTENSHEFFLEKYDEPDGNEIEHLAETRQWIAPTDQKQDREESFDVPTIRQAIKETFQSRFTPMAMYALGDYTMSEVIEECCNDENQMFDSMQQNSNDL